MAKIEAELHGSFDMILMDLNNAVMSGSTSATLEESTETAESALILLLSR